MRHPFILFMSFIFSAVTVASEWLPITLHDPILGNRTFYYENRDGDAILEGDILFRLSDSTQVDNYGQRESFLILFPWNYLLKIN